MRALKNSATSLQSCLLGTPRPRRFAGAPIYYCRRLRTRVPFRRCHHLQPTIKYTLLPKSEHPLSLSPGP